MKRSDLISVGIDINLPQALTSNDGHRVGVYRGIRLIPVACPGF